MFSARTTRLAIALLAVGAGSLGAAAAQDTPAGGAGATTGTPPSTGGGAAPEETHDAPPGGGVDDDDVDPSDAPQEGAPAHAPVVYDYSRFSDGPRRVPPSRGPAFERARRLGLGTRATATQLLTRPPDRRWMRAVRGRVPTTLLWPAPRGWFGRGFGLTRRIRRDLPHNGIDMVAPARTPIRAAADGIVAYSDNGIRGYGNCILIVHANGWVTLYGHTFRTLVQAGYRVHRGEKIAEVGQTGIAHGPHLHFELRENGHLVDPVHLFPRVPHRPRSAGSPGRTGAGNAARAATPRVAAPAAAAGAG